MIEYVLKRLRSRLITLLTPFSKAVGKLYIAPHKRMIKYSDISDFMDSVNVGDVICSYSRGEATNLLIDGDFKHCAIYIGGNYLVEAVGAGVRSISVEDFCQTKDIIAILRASFCTSSEAEKAAQFAVSQLNKPYDYGFEPNDDAFYCAELVSTAFMVATHDLSPFVKREVLGVMTVLPNDFYMARKKFDLILELPC